MGVEIQSREEVEREKSWITEEGEGKGKTRGNGRVIEVQSRNLTRDSEAPWDPQGCCSEPLR